MMRIFISGGCKNGKSYYAQRLTTAQRTCGMYYIATMKSVDSEDDERIANHRKEREGWGFVTIEQPTAIENILNQSDPSGSFLLDSLTALLANEMFFSDGNVNEKATEKITEGLSRVLSQIENIVIVSDYIYSDSMLYDPFTEKYRESLAEIDRAAARLCDAVLEVSYTNVVVHKGGEAFDAIIEKIR